MAGQPEIAYLERVVFVYKKVVGFDIAMDDSMAVEVADYCDDLCGYFLLVLVGEIDLALMDEVIQSALFHQFHDEAKLGGSCNRGYHEYDIWMAIFSQHIYLVVELVQQLLTDVGIEHFLYCHLQLEVPAFMDRAKTAHRNLFPYIQIAHLQHQHTI